MPQLLLYMRANNLMSVRRGDETRNGSADNVVRLGARTSRNDSLIPDRNLSCKLQWKTRFTSHNRPAGQYLLQQQQGLTFDEIFGRRHLAYGTTLGRTALRSQEAHALEKKAIRNNEPYAYVVSVSKAES